MLYLQLFTFYENELEQAPNSCFKAKYVRMGQKIGFVMSFYVVLTGALKYL